MYYLIFSTISGSRYCVEGVGYRALHFQYSMIVWSPIRETNLFSEISKTTCSEIRELGHNEVNTAFIIFPFLINNNLKKHLDKSGTYKVPLIDCQ